MKILYISVPPFFDLDLSIISNLSEFSEVYYLIDMPPHFQSASAFQVNDPKLTAGINNAEVYPELHKFSSFIRLDRFFVINRLSSKTYALSNIRLQKKIADFIDKINPDVIHCGHFIHEYFYYFLLKNRRKIVLTIHDPFPHSGEFTKRKNLNRKVNYLFIKDIILLNKAQKDDFIKAHPGKFRNVFLSRLGIYEYLRNYKTTAKKDNKFRILFFGRISPYKGIHILLDAFEKLENKHPDVELIIAGNGKYWFDISKYQEQDTIKILNRYISNQELVDLLSQSSLVVCPYLDATQSGVVMSAFALNKPVLGTNVGGLPEMIQDQITGFLVEPNNAGALLEKLNYISENSNLLKQIKNNIETEYSIGDRSWSKICQGLIEIYNQI